MVQKFYEKAYSWLVKNQKIFLDGIISWVHETIEMKSAIPSTLLWKSNARQNSHSFSQRSICQRPWGQKNCAASRDFPLRNSPSAWEILLRGRATKRRAMIGWIHIMLSSPRLLQALGAFRVLQRIFSMERIAQHEHFVSSRYYHCGMKSWADSTS